MPIYDFICPTCNEKEANVVLTLQEVKDDKKIICTCGAEMVRQFPDNTTFRLDGTGWTPKFGK